MLLFSVVIIYYALFSKFHKRFTNIFILILAILAPATILLMKKEINSSEIALGTDLYYGLKYKDVLDFKKLTNQNEKVLFHKDGLYSSVTVIEDKEANIVAMKTNSKLEAAAPLDSKLFSRADMQTQYLLATIANIFRTEIERSLLIGMGSGISLDLLAMQKNIKKIDVAELEPLVYQASDRFFKQYFQGDHSKVTRYTENAKYFLLQNDEKYDLIVSQPSDPWLSVEMFTNEFWDLSKEHLTDKGIFVQWLQLYSLDFEHLLLVLNTMKKAIVSF